MKTAFLYRLRKEQIWLELPGVAEGTWEELGVRSESLRVYVWFGVTSMIPQASESAMDSTVHKKDIMQKI